MCIRDRYTDKPYVAVNGNVPYFTESELTDQSYEYYSDLDALGDVYKRQRLGGERI